MNAIDFYKAYQEAEQDLRNECNELVRNGEMTQDEADFRFMMVRDEILESMIYASE